MTRGTNIRAAVLIASIGLLLALPGTSSAATSVSLDLGKGGAHRALLEKVRVNGFVLNPNPGEQVDVKVSASGRELFKRTITPKTNGTFEVPFAVKACCRYLIETKTTGGQSAAVNFGVRVPKKLRRGRLARLFNRSLQAQGFHTGTNGRRVNRGTHLAIKAFRKVNGMPRAERYSPKVFRALLKGDGAFKPQYNDGRHVEVDLSRQVMALVEGDVPTHTFHISSGTGGTPTIRGNFRFYRKDAGYNSKRMYFSVYFHGGYATHGYNPVPNRPASHGCVRNPTPFSRFIYNWVEIGMPIHVYG